MKRLILIGLLLGLSYSQTTYTGSSVSATSQGVFTSDLAISASGTITDINIKLDATSGSSGFSGKDLKLVSPYGTIVDLMVSTNPSGYSLSATTLDDEATTTISSGSAPYFGSFQPDGSLSDFDGQSMTGTWQLWIYSSQTSPFVCSFRTNLDNPFSCACVRQPCHSKISVIQTFLSDLKT